MAKICELPEHVIRVAREGGGVPPAPGGCFIKPLPERLQHDAAAAAAAINPANAADNGSSSLPSRIARLMALPQRFWGSTARVLSVTFMEAEVPPSLQQRILQHMNDWDCSSISFVQAPTHQASADIRITLQPEPACASSCFAYLGTDALLVPQSRPNMSLVGLTPATPESELTRTVCHVTGHLLGFQHVPLAPDVLQQVDVQKAYVWFRQNQGWNPSLVDRQLLQPSPAAAALSDSVMSFWLPGGLMRHGQEVFGATSITAADRAMCQARYPR